MVKTHTAVSIDKHNAVPPYKKFKMDLKISKNKPFHERPSTIHDNQHNETMNIMSTRVPKRVNNINLNHHHNPIHPHIHQQQPPQHQHQHQHQPLPQHPTHPQQPQQPQQQHYHYRHPQMMPIATNDDSASYHSTISRHSLTSSHSVRSSSTTTATAIPIQPMPTTVTPNMTSSMVFPVNTSNGNDLLNPFNDPPANCLESDVRWIWRKTLEERRGHIRNRRFYANYVGSKKSRKFYVIRTADPNKSTIESSKTRFPSTYCGNHHLKHLVKIGCPKHDLFPILHDLGYTVTPSICTHKSHICPSTPSPSHDNAQLLATVSMKDIGLVFKRNAFSTSPLNIEYIPNEDDAKQQHTAFRSDIYVKRIANTNFSKAFRPGSYGKLQSLKKGSWKEGKIFYVFDNDELTLTINENLFITFDLKSCASNSNNEQNTIDGWKNIVGGVGFYRAPETRNISSVLVLRKHPNFPLECLQNSMVRIYACNDNGNSGLNGKLYIGSKGFSLGNNAETNVNHNNMNHHSNSNNMEPSAVSTCSPSPKAYPVAGTVISNHSSTVDSASSGSTPYNDDDEEIDDRMQLFQDNNHNQHEFNNNNNTYDEYKFNEFNGGNSNNRPIVNGNNSNNGNYTHQPQPQQQRNIRNNRNNSNNRMVFPRNNNVITDNHNHNNNSYNNQHNYNQPDMMSNVPSFPSYQQQQHSQHHEKIERMKKEFEARYRALQQQNNVLLRKNNQLSALNMQLMSSNTGLEQEKQQLTTQIQELQGYMTQQHEQITKLNDQIDSNLGFVPPTEEFPMLFPANHDHDGYPNNNYPDDNYSINDNHHYQPWNSMMPQ